MKEWLKEINLEPDFSKRITKNVMKRAKKRKITERIAISSLSFFFVAFLIVLINFSPFTGKGSHSDLSFAVLPTEESSNSHPQSAPVLSLDKGRVREGFPTSGNPTLPSPERGGEIISPSYQEGNEGRFPIEGNPTLPSPERGGEIISPSYQEGNEGRFPSVVTPPCPPLKGEESVTPKLQKVDDSLEITWQGEGEFLVYKCESPKFDTCSFVKVVKGNKFLDKNEGSGKIVFYRIEPLKKG